jgi:hypothetical protein
MAAQAAGQGPDFASLALDLHRWLVSRSTERE